MSRPPLVLCAKSPWDPPLRREHAFAREAALHGHTVDFVEQPADIRALATIGRRWLRLGGGCLCRPGRADQFSSMIVSRTTSSIVVMPS